MAVNNTLQKNNKFNMAETKFDVNGVEVKLSPNTVRQYLVSGNGNITDQEALFFIKLCQSQKLNPFIKDAYCIKFGNSPAQVVVSKDVFLKRAEANEDFDGLKAGVIVMNRETGEIVYRNGAFSVKSKEETVGGWAEVHRKSKSTPIRSEVTVDEYTGRKSNGEMNAMWASKTNTMIRKVALCQALREAFPNSFQGMYGAEELNVDEEKIDNNLPKEESEILDALESNNIISNETYNELKELHKDGRMTKDELSAILKLYVHKNNESKKNLNQEPIEAEVVENDDQSFI